MFDLVHYLQGELHITVPIQEITPANFRTIATIAALVDRLRTGGPAGRGGA